LVFHGLPRRILVAVTAQSLGLPLPRQQSLNDGSINMAGMKKCPRCGSISSDARTICGLCGASFENASRQAAEVEPWIDEGPHRTERCQICRARIPHDEIHDHYVTFHGEWAEWLSQRKWFYRFEKVSLPILPLLALVWAVTGNPWYFALFLLHGASSGVIGCGRTRKGEGRLVPDGP